MDLSERSEERPQGLLRDERRQPADEDGSVVRVRRSEQLAIRPNKVAQDRTRLLLMLPRLLSDIELGSVWILTPSESRGDRRGGLGSESMMLRVVTPVCSDGSR